jgi:hypothetical protein
MNENPGETPNPLNPNPGDNPDSNGSTFNDNPSDQVESVDTAQPEQVDPLMQATAGITDQTNSDPLSRPMEQAPVQEPVQPPKKKKTGLIIGVVVALLVAIGCGIAVAIMLMNQGDAVSKAVMKLMDGKAPTNVAIDGTIDITPIDNTSLLTGLKIDLKTDATTNSMINHATANVTASIKEMGDIEVDIEEIYSESGDLYLKADGLVEAIEKISTMAQNTMATNCIDDESGLTNCGTPVLSDCEDSDGNTVPCEEEALPTGNDVDTDLDMFAGFSGILELIDGKWLKISVDQLKSMTNTQDSNNALTCLTDLADEAKNSSNTISELYRNNPFIGSTTEDVKISSKNSTVYRVVFDREKFTNYSKAVKDSTIVKKAMSCLGEDNVEISSDPVEDINKLPNLYVEIDKDDNFSRLYFETTAKQMASDDCDCPDGAVCSACETTEQVEKDIANVKVDLGFTYPSTINVAEPTDYQDIMTLLQQLMLSSGNNTTDF